MDFGKSLFEQPKQIWDSREWMNSKIVWVADLFVDEYVGGAELSSQALIDSSPFSVYKLHSKDVSLKTLEYGMDKFWIFSNFAGMDLNLIPAIIMNMKYVVLEWDYKCCSYRNIILHQLQTGQECDCEKKEHGKLIAAFFAGAQHIFFMSEKQRDIYQDKFPNLLTDENNTILSSIFDDYTLGALKLLKDKFKDVERKGWIITGGSWVKGTEQAIQYAKEHNLEYEVLNNLPYEQVLEKLAKAEGLIHLPAGHDTCARILIETRLLGGKIITNEYSQHVREDWFYDKELITIV